MAISLFGVTIRSRLGGLQGVLFSASKLGKCSLVQCLVTKFWNEKMHRVHRQPRVSNAGFWGGENRYPEDGQTQNDQKLSSYLPKYG